jgi:hypothetical protein
MLWQVRKAAVIKRKANGKDYSCIGTGSEPHNPCSYLKKYSNPANISGSISNAWFTQARDAPKVRDSRGARISRNNANRR